MNASGQWQECRYEDTTVYPRIVGTAYMLTIGDAVRYVHAGVYPTRSGWELHVQNVKVVDRSEFHAPLHTAVTRTDAEARSVAEVLARHGFMALPCD